MAGFTGWNTIYSCDYPQFGNDPDPHPIFFPGNGTYNPNLFTCGVDTVVIPGIDGTEDQRCWANSGAVSNADIALVSSQPAFNGLISGRFGLMDTTPIHNVYMNYQNGDMHAGVFCAYNDVGGGVIKGFSVVMSKISSQAYPSDLGLGNSVALLAIENDFANYTVIAKKSNAWTHGQFHSVTLGWVIDPSYLKGIYLLAAFDNILLAEVVYTAPGSYRPDIPGYFGEYAIAPPTSLPGHNSRVIIFRKV